MTASLIVALIVFIILSGLFSASETAMFSLSPMRIRAFRESDNPRERLVAKLISQPRNLLVTILMLNVVVNILVQNIASSLFADFSGWGLKVGLPLVLTLLFGELTPKVMALPNNQRYSRLIAPVIGFFHKFLAPIRVAVSWITVRISRTMFFFLRRQKEISHDELRMALKESEGHGVLTADESELISRYLNFEDVTAREMLRPRDEILFYDLEDPVERLIHLFTVEECSKLPVCRGQLEDIVGVIEASDFFLIRDRIKTPQDLIPFLSKPVFVPETAIAPKVLVKLDQSEEELAIVVDEFGSVAGLLTREDLMEVVVGEIADKRDVKNLYTRAGPDVIIASGKLELQEFNEIFRADLSSEGNLVTLGGWLTEQLEIIPKAGTKLTYGNLLFHVLAADPNRVRRIYVRRLADEKPRTLGRTS